MYPEKSPSVADQVQDAHEPEKHSQLSNDDASSINSEALGNNLPPGYFYSFSFLGTIVVCFILCRVIPTWNNKKL